MAISSEHLPMDSTSEQWTLERHLLTVQAAIINQIAQVTHGKWILDEVLHLIALQLRDALQVTDCLIFQTETSQQISAFDAHSVSAHASSKGAALKSLSVSVGTAQQEGRDVSQARLYSVCSEFCQYYHSKLAEGKSVTIPRGEPRLPLALQNLARKFNLCTILIVPLLHRQSYLGAITLYQCEQEREWLPQEIACVQAIAAHCAIALTLAELEQRYETELKDRQESSAKNRALLKAIPDLIFRVSRDGIYFVFQAAKEDALPIPASEMIGRHLHQVLPTEVAGLIWHHVELALETNEMQIVEYQLWLNGKSHNFEARLVNSGSDEVTVIVQDITERVQARVALEQVNDALEIRVAERTAALKEANYVLRAEIIDRKRAEKQLRESEERFRNLVETSSDWVWEADENAVYTYASPQVKSLLGYEPSEVLGKTPSDFMPSEERQHVAILFAPLIASRQPFTCLENTNIHKEGHAVVLERKKSEKEVQFLNSITRAIFESQDFYAALGVALQKVCEATGWDFGEAWVPMADGSVLECSPAWFSKTQSLDPFRCASEKLTFPPNIGLPGRVWVSQHPEWRRNVSAESHEVYLRARLARDVGLKSALGIPIIANEGVLAVLVFYMFESKDEDQRLIELISASTELGLMIQRKQAEGEIRKALEKEKELTELKSRFISMTSHEFRTPLTTIHSSAELLEHYSYKWTEDKKLTHLQRIQASVKHMTKLLNDVLILGKAEAGKLKLNLVPLELENFCRNLVEELQLNDTNQHTIIFTCSKDTRDRLQVSKLNVQRSIRIDPLDSAAQYGNDYAFQPSNLQPSNLPTYPFGERFANNLQPTPSGNADAQRLANASLSRTTFNLIPCMDEKLLRQILENLLSNAIKYSQTGSTVEFTLSYLEKQAVFQICDRGIGIPIEDQQRLFETFHRATNVGTIAGTGLGLAIVKKCVDIHQGEIAVESEIGVGTTFTVTLPIYDLVPTYEENSSY